MLRLLTVWVCDCPQAAQQFLQTPSHLQFLVELITQRSNIHVSGLSALLLGLCSVADTSDAGNGMYSMISQKVGLEKYQDCLNQIIKSEDFVNAEQGKSHMNTEDLNKLMFYDYEYTLFFQRALQQITAKFKPVTEPVVVKTVGIPPNNREQQIITHYQELLLNSDQKIKNYESIINQLRTEISSNINASSSGGTVSCQHLPILAELESKVALLERENSKLKEKNNNLSTKNKELKEKKKTVKAKLTQSQRQVVELQEQINTNEVTNSTNLQILHSKIEQLQSELQEKDKKITELEAEQDDLYVVIAEKTLEIKTYKKNLGMPIDSDPEEE